jgi:hypothetical protein
MGPLVLDGPFALLKFLDQRVDPLNSRGVDPLGKKLAVALDSGFELLALVAHWHHRLDQPDNAAGWRKFKQTTGCSKIGLPTEARHYAFSV